MSSFFEQTKECLRLRTVNTWTICSVAKKITDALISYGASSFTRTFGEPLAEVDLH